jgi:hypothetical protein
MIIILTTTVFIQEKVYIYQKDPQERINTYLKSIKQWITKTNFKIIVVENSGYQFDELKEYLSDKFEIISFNEFSLISHRISML